MNIPKENPALHGPPIPDAILHDSLTPDDIIRGAAELPLLKGLKNEGVTGLSDLDSSKAELEKMLSDDANIDQAQDILKVDVLKSSVDVMEFGGSALGKINEGWQDGRDTKTGKVAKALTGNKALLAKCLAEYAIWNEENKTKNTDPNIVDLIVRIIKIVIKHVEEKLIKMAMDFMESFANVDLRTKKVPQTANGVWQNIKKIWKQLYKKLVNFTRTLLNNTGRTLKLTKYSSKTLLRFFKLLAPLTFALDTAAFIKDKSKTLSDWLNLAGSCCYCLAALSLLLGVTAFLAPVLTIIGLAFESVALLIGLFQTYKGKIYALVYHLNKFIKGIFEKIMNFLAVQVWNAIKGIFSYLFDKIIEGLGNLFNIKNELDEFVKELGTKPKPVSATNPQRALNNSRATDTGSAVNAFSATDMALAL